MDNMQKNPQSISPQDAMRMANSPAGQQLIRLLQQRSGERLENAMNQAASGNYQDAQNLLRQFLSAPEIQELVEKLGGQL